MAEQQCSQGVRLLFLLTSFHLAPSEHGSVKLLHGIGLAERLEISHCHSTARLLQRVKGFLILSAWPLPQILHSVKNVSDCFLINGPSSLIIGSAVRRSSAKPFKQPFQSRVLCPFIILPMREVL